MSSWADEEMHCPVCGEDVRYKVTVTRKGRPSVMFSCPRDARHMRGFINDPKLMAELVGGVAGQEDGAREA